MSKYIVTYTKRTHFNGNEPKHIKCNTLKEVKDEIFKLKKESQFTISDIQIWATEEITKFINFIKEEICNTQ